MGKTGPGADENPTITPDPEAGGYVLRNRYMFKIGRAGDWMNKWITRHRAPFCYVEIEYRIERMRSDFMVPFSIRFSGTAIPSQAYYLSWQRRGLHDMLMDDDEEITAFMKGKKCREAPGRFRPERWHGTVEVRL